MRTKKTKPKKTVKQKPKKTVKQKPKKPSKQKISGYWVHKKAADKWHSPLSYYVEPYKRKKPSGKYKKHLRVRVYPGKRLPPLPKGYVLDKHYDIEAPEERITYTYKIEALVEYQGRYVMAFSLDKNLKGQVALEYYHTKFEPTIVKATVDFHEQMKLLRAYGHIVKFVSIDLYRVSGVGKLSDMHWKLIRSYNEPEDVK